MDTFLLSCNLSVFLSPLVPFSFSPLIYFPPCSLYPIVVNPIFLFGLCGSLLRVLKPYQKHFCWFLENSATMSLAHLSVTYASLTRRWEQATCRLALLLGVAVWIPPGSCMFVCCCTVCCSWTVTAVGACGVICYRTLRCREGERLSRKQNKFSRLT